MILIAKFGGWPELVNSALYLAYIKRGRACKIPGNWIGPDGVRALLRLFLASYWKIATSKLQRSIVLSDIQLHRSFQQLWADADAVWEANHTQPEYSLYVSADYQAIFDQLRNLRGRVNSVLEWGSGLGVVSIMASRMGFEAYGIEVESKLVSLAEELAAKYDAKPTFAVGSFIPADFAEDPSRGIEFGRTSTTATAAYEDLDLELQDFDLIYAFPWPDEHAIYRRILRQHAADNALYLRYDAREGLSLSRINQSRKR
jgi:hypothetical protein